MDTFDLKELNAYFKSNEDLRLYLEAQKKIVLPFSQQKGITTDYFLQVAQEKVLTIPEAQYKPFRGVLAKKATKSEIHDQLVLLAQGKSTGFTEGRLPSKQWLLDCLHSLDCKNAIFRRLEEKIPREFPEG